MVDLSTWGHEEGNPANENSKIDAFESRDLQECLDHYNTTSDSGPLEMAIFYNNLKIKATIDLLGIAILSLIEKEERPLATFLTSTRERLQR